MHKAKAVRSHWDIENSLHWVLDVAFREDTSTKRAGNTAQNYALINKICLFFWNYSDFNAFSLTIFMHIKTTNSVHKL
jgi:predicted transposase YbfD/YdcC